MVISGSAGKAVDMVFNLRHRISGRVSLRMDLTVHAPLGVNSKSEQREDSTDCGEVARSFLGAARHVLTEPCLCELPGRIQLSLCLFPFGDRDRFFMWLLRVATVGDEVHEGDLAVPVSPTLNREFVVGFRFRDHRSRR